MITLLATAVFVLGAWIARVRTGTWLNPFTPPLFIFALEAALAGGVGGGPAVGELRRAVAANAADRPRGISE